MRVIMNRSKDVNILNNRNIIVDYLDNCIITILVRTDNISRNQTGSLKKTYKVRLFDLTASAMAFDQCSQAYLWQPFGCTSFEFRTFLSKVNDLILVINVKHTSQAFIAKQGILNKADEIENGAQENSREHLRDSTKHSRLYESASESFCV